MSKALDQKFSEVRRLCKSFQATDLGASEDEQALYDWMQSGDWQNTSAADMAEAFDEANS